MTHRLRYATPPRHRLSPWLRWFICVALLGGVFLVWLGVMWCMALVIGPG